MILFLDQTNDKSLICRISQLRGTDSRVVSALPRSLSSYIYIYTHTEIRSETEKREGGRERCRFLGCSPLLVI